MCNHEDYPCCGCGDDMYDAEYEREMEQQYWYEHGDEPDVDEQQEMEDFERCDEYYGCYAEDQFLDGMYEE